MAKLYRSLGQGRREFRLLNLLKSDSFDSPIRGKLVHTSLDDHEPYETISYVWGAPRFTQTIELESQPFGVTRHLENALRHLRLTSKDRTLWVDAVCINQSDDVERGEQVMLMKQIYESCTGNLVWLYPMVYAPSIVPEGEGQDEMMGEEQGWEDQVDWEDINQGLRTMERGVELFNKIYTRDIKYLEPMRHKRGESDFWRLMTEELKKEELSNDKPGDDELNDDEVSNDKPNDDMPGDDEPNDDVWLLEYKQIHGLRAIFHRPSLWSRIWVMQELSCAPRISLIIGKQTLDWDMLDSFLGDAEYSDSFHMEWGHSSVGSMTGSVFSKVKTIQNQRAMTQAGKPSSLMDVLARFKGSKSTDPRDKIYGLLGLTSQSREVRVDYSKSVAEVYTDVATVEISGSANLDIITQNPFQGNDTTKRLAGLPSWVPDFSCNAYDDYSSQYSSILFAQRGIYSAGSTECKVPCEVLPGCVLRLHGTVVGRVGLLLLDEWEHPYSQDGPDWQLQNIHTYKKLYLSPDVLESSATYVNGESELQAFWRTLVGDCIAYPMVRLDDVQIAEDGKAFWEFMQEPLTSESRWYEFYSTLKSGKMMDKMFTRWMFTKADNGLFLMVRQGTREGDVIVVVDGGKVPLLLREVEGSGGERYTAVNAAYVHGFMDGEARTWVEEGKLAEQDFLLV
ncbi:hypothetical protein V492_01770 [Pseudogymnoascus sp. VKM F-4246]|nr:hypothetical protein V492_01770 [Pseudogymnoascus sp. VKM F-4246]